MENNIENFQKILTIVEGKGFNSGRFLPFHLPRELVGKPEKIDTFVKTILFTLQNKILFDDDFVERAFSDKTEIPDDYFLGCQEAVDILEKEFHL